MGVLDKFLNAMKLNDDEDMDDDEFLDDEVDDFEEERPKKHLFKSRDEDDDDDDYEEPKRRTKSSQVKSMPKQKTSRQTQTTQVLSSSTSNKVSPIRPRKRSSAAISGEIFVLKPHSLNEAYQITDALLNNCTVILNLEEAPPEEIQRVVDFSSGTCYALSGKIEQISPNNNKMFVITPETVELSGEFQKRMGTAIDVHSRF